jgi:hypothetical protein
VRPAGADIGDDTSNGAGPAARREEGEQVQTRTIEAPAYEVDADRVAGEMLARARIVSRARRHLESLDAGGPPRASRTERTAPPVADRVSPSSESREEGECFRETGLEERRPCVGVRGRAGVLWRRGWRQLGLHLGI